MNLHSGNNTTARKCLAILMAFSPLNKGLGTMEISRKLGINKSSVSKLLSVLKETAFIQQNPENNKHSLGPAIAKLGQARANYVNSLFIEAANPVMEQIRDEVKETVILAMPLSHAFVQVHVAEGLAAIRMVAYPGNITPYHTAAGGKVLLAFGPPGIRDRILAGKLKKKTEYTNTAREVLKKKLEQIRRDGFCFSSQENHIGISAFAVPIFDREGVAFAAIVTAGSAQILTWEKRHEYVPSLKNGAAQISAIFLEGGEQALSPRNIVTA